MVELQTLHGKDCAHIQYIHVHVVPSNDINAYYYSAAWLVHFMTILLQASGHHS